MAVKIELDHRHYGIHSPVSEAEIPGEFADYATPRALPNADRDEYAVDEDRLLAALPDGFLPVGTRSVLLMVADEDGGTALSGLSRFRPWAKYFDAYTLNIFKPAPAPSPDREDSR
jgi:hypothetical protein